MNITDDSLYWVYILHCENNSYYTGYTTDLQKRYQSHVNGTGKCKYTRSFKPLFIAQSWQIKGSRAVALKLEREIKKLSRAEKETLIANPGLLEGEGVSVYGTELTTPHPQPFSPEGEKGARSKRIAGPELISQADLAQGGRELDAGPELISQADLAPFSLSREKGWG